MLIDKISKDKKVYHELTGQRVSLRQYHSQYI